MARRSTAKTRTKRDFRIGRIGDLHVVTVKAPSLSAALDLAAERCGWEDLDGVTADVRAGRRWIPAVEAEERLVKTHMRAQTRKKKTKQTETR